jgi:hypothetical protein
LCTNFLDGLHI